MRTFRKAVYFTKTLHEKDVFKTRSATVQYFLGMIFLVFKCKEPCNYWNYISLVYKR